MMAVLFAAYIVCTLFTLHPFGRTSTVGKNWEWQEMGLDQSLSVPKVGQLNLFTCPLSYNALHRA